MEHNNGKILHNNYRIKKFLGKGAMGNVYLVEHIKDRREMVVKELVPSPDSKLTEEICHEIFFRESEFISKFNHPGLPEMYGTFRHDGHDYIVMEYIKGQTLEEMIKKSSIEENKAIRWTVELASILNYLHNSFEKPVVYRDLKPANIMITPQNKVKLIDFGISRYYDPDKDTDTFRLGSPGYAAPEQYKGRGQSRPQSDIFSLGVILYQMLTGYDPTLTPFKFPPARHLKPSINQELEKIVEKAIELNPMKRYIGVMEFKENLDKYLSSPYKDREEKPLKEISGKKKKKKKKSIKTIETKPVLTVEKEKRKYEQGDLSSTLVTVLLLVLFLPAALIFIGIMSETNSLEYDAKCEENIKTIATYLETYSVNNNNLYPHSLNYTHRPGSAIYVHTCPATKHVPYLYNVSSDLKNYTICCGGISKHITNHSLATGHFPQYSPGRGIIWYQSDKQNR
jgi:serine/threonine protein kinase